MKSLCCGLGAWMLLLGAVAAERDKARTVLSLNEGFRLTLSKPVVVSLADPGERRWGRHQFVSLSRYPGGKLLLRFHAGEDSVRAYGSGQPTFISADQGTAWVSADIKTLPGSGLICAFGENQWGCTPMPPPFKLAQLKEALPKHAGEFTTYRKIALYRASECPEAVQNYLREQPCWRWDGPKQNWDAGTVEFDMRDRLVWIGQGIEKGLISGTTFERSPIRVGNELLWADYRSVYAMPDGTAPNGFGVSCMVSTNDGRSWQRRSPIVNADAMVGEISSMTEPVLCQSSLKEIICIIRRTDQKQKTMLISFSKDNGFNWGKPRAMEELGNFGVMPDLIRLDSGPLVLAYGRPGVNLSFSMDGSGKMWEPSVSVLAGDPNNTNAGTDGYASLMPVGRNEFLVAYSNFNYVDDLGQTRKAILVQRASLEKGK